MATIDITMMRGVMPRVVDHLLPEANATLAQDCHFRHGVITPMQSDSDQRYKFTFQPQTIFYYQNGLWFAWNKVVDAIRSPVVNDDYGRIYYTDGEFPKVTGIESATVGTGGYPVAFFRLGIPAPINPVVVGSVTPPAEVGKDDPIDDETRYYTETYVTAYGEEGPPGPVTKELTIPYPGSSVKLHLQPPYQQNNNITKRRIYRSATSSQSADFLLVDELNIAIGTFVDDFSEAKLSASLETYDYFMPPDGMIGLCMMSNGIAAGFKGNQVMFSEAYLPYAWKDSNKQTTQDEIVAIAAVGTTLVVGTKGIPYIFSGISPSNITSTHSLIALSCVSRQSMVTMDGFALYASPNGLVSISASGAAEIATASIIEAKQWRSMFNPSSIRAWRVENEYLALYDTDDGVAGFIFDPVSMDIRHITASFDCAYNDESSDTLYITKGKALYAWGDGESLNCRWRSKVYLAPENAAFSCLRIMSDAPAEVGVILYADKKAVLDLPPGSLRDSTVKLPPLRGKCWQIEVYGSVQVDRITLSTSMLEMPP
ncbi:hypothetical protein J5069_02930 [Candidatus Symbiopectobacterium sp. NZEC127]|uniref:hypothetical protein n=1 Tax=Candidatus Symbiopectobacterium sp. NZEC127 TaxID=2820472 RepID=UPI002226D8BE|nr:hypothetical protein [Candidatus Symbiopectobacterium sp. NZEC127]MCW2484845.1 hypothetical protein [Candidatus Symbiopectobacterium sp. NZEC127]